MEEKTWEYKIDEERKAIISIEDRIVKSVIDYIDDPDAHFKANDLKRFGIYDWREQSFEQFIEKPYLTNMPQDLHNEIVDYIKLNFSKEDFKLSAEAEAKIERYIWVPVDEKDENTAILDYYEDFITTLVSKLEDKGIKIDDLKIDHIGYQASSTNDYEDKVEMINKISSPLSESIVGGRRVGIFKLKEPLAYENQSFFVIEIVEPKKDQIVDSGWEHIEFLVPGSLEGFIKEYPRVDWDESVMDRDEFPMLILKLEGGLRAKFPRLGVEDELERQRKNKIKTDYSS